MERNNIYKCRLSYRYDGKVSVVRHANRQIPADLLNKLTIAVQSACNEYNGEADWMKTYVHFGYEGVNYKQVDATHLCEGCCFLKDQQKCTHPHFYTKPNCTGKIYVIDK